MDVEKRGYLYKEGGSWRSWKRRFFILEHQELRYWKNEKECISDVEPIGVIPVAGVNVLRLSKGERSDKKFGFKVESKIENNRVYYFNAEKLEDMSDWMIALQKASGVDAERTENKLRRTEQETMRTVTGWLNKHGGFDGKKPLKKRFCYMDSDSLKYYADPKDPSPKGEIMLIGAKMVDVNNSTLEFHLREGGEDDRIYIFKADDAESFQLWTKAILENLDRLDRLLKRAMNFWTQRSVYTAYLAWRAAMELRGLETQETNDKSLVFFTQKDFRPSKSAPGKDQWDLKDHDSTLTIEKLGEPMPLVGPMMYQAEELQSILLHQVRLLFPQGVRVRSVQGVPAREEEYAMQDCAVWFGQMAVVEIDDIVSAVALLRRSFLPPMGESCQHYLVRVQKSRRSASVLSCESLIQSVLNTLRPSPHQQLTVESYGDPSTFPVQPVLASTFWYSWADVVLNFVPKNHDKYCEFVIDMQRSCWTGKHEFDYTKSLKELQSSYLAACVDGHLFGERFHLEHVSRSFRRAKKLNNEFLKKLVMDVVLHCLGLQTSDITLKAMEVAFGSKKLNESFLARLLDVYFFDFYFAQSPKPKSAPEAQAQAAPPLASGNGSLVQSDITPASPRQPDEVVEEKPLLDLSSPPASPGGDSATGAAGTTAPPEIMTKPSAPRPTRRWKKESDEEKGPLAREYIDILFCIFKNAESDVLRTSIMLKLALLMTSHPTLADSFVESNLPLENIFNAIAGLPTAAGSFASPSGVSTSSLFVQLHNAALRLAVNLSPQHGFQDYMSSSATLPGYTGGFFKSLHALYLAPTAPFGWDSDAVRCVVLLMHNMCGRNEERIIELSESGDVVYSLMDRVDKVMNIVCGSSPSDEPALQAIFQFLWRLCTVKTIRRICIQTKGIGTVCAKLLRETLRSDEAKAAVVGFLLSMATEYGDRIGKSTDLMTAICGALSGAVLPQLMLYCIAVLLPVCEQAPAKNKVKQIPELEQGLRRALRFRKDPQLVRFAMTLEQKLA